MYIVQAYAFMFTETSTQQQMIFNVGLWLAIGLPPYIVYLALKIELSSHSKPLLTVPMFVCT